MTIHCWRPLHLRAGEGRAVLVDAGGYRLERYRLGKATDAEPLVGFVGLVHEKKENSIAARQKRTSYVRRLEDRLVEPFRLMRAHEHEIFPVLGAGVAGHTKSVKREDILDRGTEQFAIESPCCE
jgi:hypothetical protein